jgi:hypothetical protein
MTRIAIDAPVALRIVGDDVPVAPGSRLVGPAVLRSHALASLYRDVRAGVLDEKEGRRRLEALAGLKIRLLGDRVSRATAWRLAMQRGWDDPVPAEYLAVAVLQADVLVTEDPVLVRAAEGLIPTRGVEALDE